MRRLLHTRWFTWFLVAYVLVLGYHLFEIGISILLLFGIATGLLLAYVAHKESHGKGPLVFLVVHMAIEWWYLGSELRVFTTEDMLFHGVHAAMDAIFLYQEARMHFNQNWKKIVATVATVVLGIAIVSMIVSTGHTETVDHAHDMGTGVALLKSVVLAGMLGCIISILFARGAHAKHGNRGIVSKALR